ncbi:hypothetical protein IWW49_002580 [Coemansia sp. RSA 1797]|nr:hypothetical protein IWW49_002580 [Coemansia sp. RSA 1797]
MVPPKRRNRDSGRGSMGLGIVLTDDSHDIDFERAAAAIGLPTSQSYDPSYMGQSIASRSSRNTADEHNPEPSMFARLITNISAFMTTDTEQRPKTRIEDMLESYYLSQNRPVPDWVYDPPPDPISTERRPTSIMVETNESCVSSAEASREDETKPSPSPSMLRSFGRLNISRLIRPTLSRTQSPSSQATLDQDRSEPLSGATSRSGSRLRRMWMPQLSRSNDSGFNSPQPNLSEGSHVNIQMIDSGNNSDESIESETEYALPQFTLESSQVSFGTGTSRREPSSRLQSPFAAAMRGLDIGRVKGRGERVRSETPKLHSRESSGKRSNTPRLVTRNNSGKRNETPRLVPSDSSGKQSETPRLLTRNSSGKQSETPRLLLRENSSKDSDTPRLLTRENSGKRGNTPRLLIRGNNSKRGETPQLLSRENSSKKAPTIKLHSRIRGSPPLSRPKSRLPHESPSLQDPSFSSVVGTPVTNRKMSASLSWMSPSKWRHRHKDSELKTSEPAPDIPTSFYEDHSRHAQNATARPNRVKRLFRRKTTQK